MSSWADLNKRQQEYLQAIYETDQEQEADERGVWKRGGTPRAASVWRWMEYGVFSGVGSTLYTAQCHASCHEVQSRGKFALDMIKQA